MRENFLQQQQRKLVYNETENRRDEKEEKKLPYNFMLHLMRA
jgi:hypothetical protein